MLVWLAPYIIWVGVQNLAFLLAVGAPARFPRKPSKQHWHGTEREIKYSFLISSNNYKEFIAVHEYLSDADRNTWSVVKWFSLYLLIYIPFIWDNGPECYLLEIQRGKILLLTHDDGSWANYFSFNMWNSKLTERFFILNPALKKKFVLSNLNPLW